jgi:hypothetical protein
MNETQKTQAPRNTRYDFGNMSIGDSHYIHKAEYKRVYEAWRSYFRLHPECLTWQMQIEPTVNGVKYRRVH